MRTRIKDYKIVRINDNSAYLYVNRPKDYSVNNVAEAVRLIINETKHIPITSSMVKDVVGTVSNYTATEQIPFNTQITLNKAGAFSSANFTNTDKYTVEFDWAAVSAEDIFVDFDSDMASEIDLIIGNTGQLSGTSTETSISNLRTLVQLNGVLLSEVAKEANATSNTTTVLNAINDTLQVNMLASGVSAMAGVPINVIADDGTTTTYALNANELYYFNNRSSDLELTLDLTSVAQGDISDFHLIVQVLTGPLTVTIKDSNNNNVVWSYALTPSFASGFTYEIGIINNLALFVEYVI